MAFRTIQFDGNPHFLNANRNDEGRRLDTNFANPDNRWNDNDGFAFRVPKVFSFLPRFSGGVLFLELAIPATKHFPNFI